MARSINRPGQALAEFAMVVPILLLLVFGIIEFARAWQTYQKLTDAAREGTRQAVIASWPAPTAQSVTDAVKASLARVALHPDSADVTPSIPGTEVFPGQRGTPVTVKIEYRFHFILIGRLAGWALGQDHIKLTTSSVMRKE